MELRAECLCRWAILRATSLLLAAPAAAHDIAVPAQTAPFGMTMLEWQGVSCLWGGALGGAATFYYVDILVVAATGGVTSPLLLPPLIASGFVSGCELGASLAP